LSGRIDLMPTSVKTYEKMRLDGVPVEKAMMLAGQVYGVACNNDTPADLIQRMQAELDKLILSGEQDRIFAAYGLPPNPRTSQTRAHK
jgi:polar amino acid transport system substrate-binding protein